VQHSSSNATPSKSPLGGSSVVRSLHGSVVSDSLHFGLPLLSSAPHFRKLDLVHVGGVSCFDYMASARSIVVGTTTAAVRMLDLRVGGGCYTPAWNHAPNTATVPPAVRCISVQHEDDTSGGVDAPLIYSGLTSGDIAIFDARTGVIQYQWRGHDAQVTQLLPFHFHGSTMLISAGLDHVISVWIISTGAPVLHQRFNNLEENARGILVRPQRDAASSDSRELICAIGNKIGIGVLTSPRSSKKLTSRLSLVGIRGHKGKSVLTAIARLPAYDFTLIAQEDGKIVITK
jgi:WD40 repeat protein